MSGDQVRQPTTESAGAGASRRGSAHDVGEVVHAPIAEAPIEPVASPSSVNWRSLRNVWQIPSIIVSLTLIGIGLSASMKPAAPNDFDGALTQIEEMLEAGELEPAADRLRSVIEPNLEIADQLQKARFAAAVADFLFLTQHARQEAHPEVSTRIAKHYQDAQDKGLALTVPRMERWCYALIDSEQFAKARERLDAIDALREKETDEAVQNGLTSARNRVFRRLVDERLAARNGSFDELVSMLADYRLERNIAPADELWAIAKQTELRLEMGLARHAVDVLIVELRRLESRQIGEKAPDAIGRLYTLLGRAYFELGEYPRAKSHLEHALTMLSAPDLSRGEATALLGQIELSTGTPDAAMEHFQVVVRDFVATPSYIDGLLGRAEVQSILGDHEASMQDYRGVCEELPRSAFNVDKSKFATRVAESLCDRHDAAVALGMLERAMEYIMIAESLFDHDDVPHYVLFRLASTNRQIASDLIANAASESGAEPGSIDTGVRREANARLERAGNDYLRHFNADILDVERGGEDAVASLWLAADTFDLGGRQDLAIEHFLKYLGMQPTSDARRPQTLFRLGQAYQSILDFESAIEHYEQLITELPRSSDAAQSYVPLAQCYVAVSRTDDARQLLQQVLSGNRLLQPDASDFRDALLQLGRIEYDAGAHTQAIEAFNEFLERYPDDNRILYVRYVLADSYRNNGLAIAEKVRQEPGLSPSEAGRLTALGDDQLQLAQELFGEVSQAAAIARTQTGSLPHADLVRRAALYQADCAYYRGQLAQAIDLYDHAARQYSNHQSSMYALIQIVNAYHAIGDAERATAAHHRALVRLKQLPDSAFLATDSLMDRTAWERWLENNPVSPTHSIATGSMSERTP